MFRFPGLGLKLWGWGVGELGSGGFLKGYGVLWALHGGHRSF